MPNMKTCVVCNTSLIKRRAHCKTCSAFCRLKLHRLNKVKPISVKLVLSKIQFDLIKSQADSMGVMINQLMLDCVNKSFTNVGVTI